MVVNHSGWAERAAALPLAFAQVREDSLLDLAIVERLPQRAHICLIASGGCTAALLSTSPRVAWLHLVDPNPAQLALTRLKLRLVALHDPPRRMSLLGHYPSPAAQRQSQFTAELAALELPIETLGPADLICERGPDYAGRYETVFAELRNKLIDQARSLELTLLLSDPDEQIRRIDPTTLLGRRLDEALDEVLALPNLVRLFGEEATRNPVEPFSRHFASRIRHAMRTLPAATNPYLWSMLLGRHPPGVAAPWLMVPSPAPQPRVTWSNTFMAENLANMPATFDFIHLSNILDWLTPDAARNTLELAWQALRPGGFTLIRQLNSSLDIPHLGSQFEWLPRESAPLHARDRSFFYRALHLGRKR